MDEDERVAVVSNPVVAPLYLERAAAALRSADLEPFECTIPDGERHKNLTTISSLYGQFLAAGWIAVAPCWPWVVA